MTRRRTDKTATEQRGNTSISGGRRDGTSPMTGSLSRLQQAGPVQQLTVVEPRCPDPLAVLEWAVVDLYQAVLHHPAGRYPGTTFVAMWDALDLLDTDPTAGAAEIEAVTAGLHQVVALLEGTGAGACWHETLRNARQAAALLVAGCSLAHMTAGGEQSCTQQRATTELD